MQRERIITIGIIVGLFGGVVGGPIASLVDYYASPAKRLWLFLVPEFVGFVFLGLMIYYGKSRKNRPVKIKRIAYDIKVYTLYDPITNEVELRKHENVGTAILSFRIASVIEKREWTAIRNPLHKSDIKILDQTCPIPRRLMLPMLNAFHLTEASSLNGLFFILKL